MNVNWFQLKSFLINRFFEVKTLLKLIMLSSPDLIPKKMCLRRGGGLHESVSNINYYVCCCCALGRLTWLPIAFLLLCSWLANITSCLLLLRSWLSNTSSYYVFAATILAFQHNSYYVYIYIYVCVWLLRSSLSNITSYYSSSVWARRTGTSATNPVRWNVRKNAR